MTKRTWEECERREWHPVEDCLIRLPVVSQQTTVSQVVSHTVAQLLTEGGASNCVDVATITTPAAYSCQPSNRSEGTTVATSAANRDGVPTQAQVATTATSAVQGDTSQAADDVADAATSTAKEGEYGPFWSLLAHAGYTIWNQ